MKIGIFAKTFSRPTLEELFQAIAGYAINSVQFNLSCVGLKLFQKSVIRAGSANNRRCYFATHSSFPACLGYAKSPEQGHLS